MGPCTISVQRKTHETRSNIAKLNTISLYACRVPGAILAIAPSTDVETCRDKNGVNRSCCLWKTSGSLGPHDGPCDGLRDGPCVTMCSNLWQRVTCEYWHVSGLWDKLEAACCWCSSPDQWNVPACFETWHLSAGFSPLLGCVVMLSHIIPGPRCVEFVQKLAQRRAIVVKRNVDAK